MSNNITDEKTYFAFLRRIYPNAKEVQWGVEYEFNALQLPFCATHSLEGNASGYPFTKKEIGFVKKPFAGKGAGSSQAAIDKLQRRNTKTNNYISKCRYARPGDASPAKPVATEAMTIGTRSMKRKLSPAKLVTPPKKKRVKKAKLVAAPPATSAAKADSKEVADELFPEAVVEAAAPVSAVPLAAHTSPPPDVDTEMTGNDVFAMLAAPPEEEKLDAKQTEARKRAIVAQRKKQFALLNVQLLPPGVRKDRLLAKYTAYVTADKTPPLQGFTDDLVSNELKNDDDELNEKAYNNVLAYLKGLPNGQLYEDEEDSFTYTVSTIFEAFRVLDPFLYYFQANGGTKITLIQHRIVVFLEAYLATRFKGRDDVMKDMRSMVREFKEMETDQNKDFFDFARAKSSLAVLNANVFRYVFDTLDRQTDVVIPAVLYDLTSYLHTKSGPLPPSPEEVLAMKKKKTEIKKDLKEQKKSIFTTVYIADTKITKNGPSPELKEWNTRARIMNPVMGKAVPTMTVIKDPLFGGKAGVLGVPEEKKAAAPAAPEPPAPPAREGKIRAPSPPPPEDEKYTKEGKIPEKKERLGMIMARAAEGGPMKMSPPKSIITGEVMPAPTDELLSRMLKKTFGGGIPSEGQLASMIKLKEAEALPSFSPKPFFFDSTIPRRGPLPLPPVPTFAAPATVATTTAATTTTAAEALRASTEAKLIAGDVEEDDDDVEMKELDPAEIKCQLERLKFRQKYNEFEEEKKTEDDERFKTLTQQMVYDFISKDPKRVEDLDKHKNRQLRELQDLIDAYVSYYP